MLNREVAVDKYIEKHKDKIDYYPPLRELIAKDRADYPDTVPDALEEWRTDKAVTNIGEAVMNSVLLGPPKDLDPPG